MSHFKDISTKMVQKLLNSRNLQIMEYSYNSKPDTKAFLNKNPFYTSEPLSPIPQPVNIRRSKNVESEPGGDDLFRDLKGFLIMGKLIGLIPYSGVFANSSSELTFRRRSLSSVITHLIGVVLVMNGILGIVASFRAPKGNALEIAQSVRATLYFIWGCYLYFTFLYRGERFLDIFKAWKNSSVVYFRPDVTLKRDVAIIGSAILVSAILENGVLHLEYVKDLDHLSGAKFSFSTANDSNLKSFYWRSHPHWGAVLGYNWFLAVLAFLQHKWILYAWNYMDILIAVFGRALYFRFKMLYEVAEEKLLKADTPKLIGASQDNFTWIQVVHDHKRLCRLLEVLEMFFSPLVFGSYAINMYYICMQLLDGLTSEVSHSSITHSIYAPWSFLHLIMRTLTVSICCARINVHAHKLRVLLHDCPIEHYTAEVARVDRRITSGPEIGFSGVGCFVVTKPFILSILGVIFTFEIVLLQCVPPSAPVPSTNCN